MGNALNRMLRMVGAAISIMAALFLASVLAFPSCALAEVDSLDSHDVHNGIAMQSDADCTARLKSSSLIALKKIPGVTYNASTGEYTMKNAKLSGKYVVWNEANSVVINLVGTNVVSVPMMFIGNVVFKGSGTLEVRELSTDGKMTVNGAKVYATADGDRFAAIYAESGLSASSGALVVGTNRGAYGTGVCSNGDVNVAWKSVVVGVAEGCNSVAVEAAGSVIVSGATLNATAKAAGSRGIHVGKSMSLSKATVKSTSNSGVYVDGKVSIDGGTLYSKSTSTSSKVYAFYSKGSFSAKGKASITAKAISRALGSHGSMTLNGCNVYAMSSKSFAVLSHDKISVSGGKVTAKSSYSGKKAGALWSNGKVTFNKVNLGVSAKKGVGIAGLKGGTIKSCKGKVTSKKGYGVVSNSKISISKGSLKINGKVLKSKKKRF